MTTWSLTLETLPRTIIYRAVSHHLRNGLKFSQSAASDAERRTGAGAGITAGLGCPSASLRGSPNSSYHTMNSRAHTLGCAKLTCRSGSGPCSCGRFEATVTS